jgi:hypothetical protein
LPQSRGTDYLKQTEKLHSELAMQANFRGF